MVTVLPPGVIWRMPLCGVYLLMSIKSGMMDFTIKSSMSTAKAPYFASSCRYRYVMNISLTFFNKSTNSFVELIIYL